jgi:hypothetical protein
MQIFGGKVVLCFNSEDALLVALKLHDEGLNVLALALPVGDALLGVRVEVLLLLVEKSLSLQGIDLTVLEFSHDGLILYSGLLALEVLQFLGTLSLFLLLLFLSHLQLFVANLPEFGELDLFALHSSLNVTLPLDLQLS